MSNSNVAESVVDMSLDRGSVWRNKTVMLTETQKEEKTARREEGGRHECMKRCKTKWGEIDRQQMDRTERF
jgi:hypothetical protein